MTHAERFCELVADLELRRRSRTGDGRRWLVRRRQEVVTVLELLVRDWAEGRIAIEETWCEIDGYLRDLHVGARRSLGLGPVLECCALGDSVTVIPAGAGETPTCVHLGLAATSNDTLFDPSALLGAPPGVPLDELTCELGRSERVLLRRPRVQRRKP